MIVFELEANVAEDIKLTSIKYEPCKRRKSLVGFVDFVYNGKFHFTDLGVHEKLDKSGYRVVYPQTTYPIEHKVQKTIDGIISEYIKTKQGASDDKQNGWPDERIY